MGLTMRLGSRQGAGAALPIDAELSELQADSLHRLALLVAVVAYVPFLCWPFIHQSVHPYLWVGIGFLAVGSALALALPRRHGHVAALILLAGTMGMVVCALFAARSYTALYLFAFPVILASTLLSNRQWALVVVQAAIVGLMVALRPVVSPLTIEAALPVVFVALVTVTSWLSVRNLHTALTWVWHGYERARSNEQIARDRQAELSRALKALDEATYRLERTNYALELARDQAEEARRLKQQFAQSVSHELRTPLNLIVGFTELMTESPDYYQSVLSASFQRDLNIVHRNARHLQSMVNDVLDLARIDSAQMSVILEEVEAETLVHQATDTVRSLVQSRGLALRTEIAPDLPALYVDPTRIRQVLINLLSNAARFTDEGGITVRAQRDGGAIVFEVSDTGVGIPPDDLPRMFEEFHQLDAGLRRRHGGVGLGLAISRRFVEMHGGRIWVESEVGSGSTFRFALPLPGQQNGAAAAPREVAVRATTAPRGEQPVLLAVSDSPTSAMLLQRYMHGVRVVVVSNLEQGQQVARSVLPQAVLLHQGHEESDMAVLHEMARAWGCPNTPFLVCPLPGEERLSRHPLVEGYLVKPVSRRDLWDLLRAYGEGVTKLLLVDDDLDFLELMTRMLGEDAVRHYDVSCAYRGQEALDMLDLYHPDLVLLDLGLPDLDGFEVVERMRSTERWQHIPIVVVSAQDGVVERQPLRGGLIATKAAGLMPSEIMQWTRAVVEASMSGQGHAPTLPARPSARPR
jgi:signal transduction histidine kinase/DNA-binding response OmpR family regulator